MADIAHYWSGDLQVGATGDLQVASSVLESQQRILRRLLTNPNDYLWQSAYGAGLPKFIGQLLNIDLLNSIVKSQMFMERSVVQTPAPQVTVSAIANGMSALIQYVETDSGQQAFLNFDVTNEPGVANIQ